MTRSVLFAAGNDGIATITLNDPGNLNAMSDEMAADFSAVISSIKSDPSGIRVLVLTGNGKAFSSGGHLEMLERKKSLTPEENVKGMRRFYASFLDVLNLNLPIVAAINGSAIGAGLCIACGCDIRIATVEAKFGFTFTKLGLHPGMGATYFVPQVVGHARATELLLTARVITAAEALTWGLVSRVVPREDLDSTVREIASEILACGPQATRSLVQTLRNRTPTLDSALEREAQSQSLDYGSPEFAEGLAAIKEKRKPKFCSVVQNR